MPASIEEVPVSEQPEHEIVDLEDDPSVPPRPEEIIADATSDGEQQS